MGGIALVSHLSHDLTADLARDTTADGFAQAVQPHYAGLVRRLTVVLGDADTALDLAQETYLRAFRAWDRFNGTDARAWLHTIGLRLAFNERSRRRRWRSLLGLVRRPAPQPWVQERDLDLHAALAELRPEHRAALLMNVVDGYTQAAIAEMLGVAPGTVASWISRAKASLRVALDEGIEEVGDA
jgi:RNA polymerase sigma-70 factor (ECF subfamily)